MTAKAAEKHVLENSEQLLEQCGHDDSLEMASLSKPKFAQLHNSQQLIAKLPNELIVEIGEYLLESNAFLQDKSWYSKILPLFQTSVHLRAALRPLLPKTLEFYTWIPENRAFDDALQQLAKWKKGWPHELRVDLIANVLSTMTGGLRPSAAAAIAADLERAIYGTLLDKPAVFVRCRRVPDEIDDVHWIFVSSRGREWEIIAWPWNNRRLEYLTKEEAALVWDSESSD